MNKKNEAREKNDKTQSEKLQKVLARAGFASRRQCEEWISEGRVKINNKTAKLGDRITLEDQIKIDNILVSKHQINYNKTRVLIYHKPEGEICTRKDPENRPTVFDHLPTLHTGRWIAIGRLDINTSGVLLFSTSGELANQLMHPSQEIEREYAVRIFGDVTDQMLKNLTSGVELEDGTAKFNQITFKGGEARNRWYHVVLCEGRNREVRRLWESQNVKVSRLIRVRFGNILLPPLLRPGRYQELTPEEINSLTSLFNKPAQKGGVQHAITPKAIQQKALSSSHPGRIRLSRKKTI